MKKHWGISGLMAALLLPGAAGISFAQSSAQKQQTAAEKKTPTSVKNAQASAAIPEHVLYEFYFRRIALFEDLAKKQASHAMVKSDNQAAQSRDSQAAAKLHGASLKELDISDEKKAILHQVAADALSQAASLDAQADEIIKLHREQYAKKQLAVSSSDKKENQPTSDLAALQAQRDAIFMNAKASLSKQMTPGDFAKIDEHIKSTIAPAVQRKTTP
jgi:hypothetical protein